MLQFFVYIWNTNSKVFSPKKSNEMTQNNTVSLPIITSERLTLRSLVTEDQNAIYELRSNTEINKYLDRQPCSSIEQAKNFIDIIKENVEKGGTYYWVITLSDSSEVLGTICLFDISNEKKSCEIGYELSPKFQGQGIMQEAVKSIIHFVFDSLKLNMINAFTHKENQKSTHLLSKLNFVKTDEIATENPNLVKFVLTK
jgi:ribosomal-protein-alanine N-acetyltransferase